MHSTHTTHLQPRAFLDPERLLHAPSQQKPRTVSSRDLAGYGAGASHASPYFVMHFVLRLYIACARCGASVIDTSFLYIVYINIALTNAGQLAGGPPPLGGLSYNPIHYSHIIPYVYLKRVGEILHHSNENTPRQLQPEVLS